MVIIWHGQPKNISEANMSADRAGSHFARRLAVATVGVLICLWLMWGAARGGASRLLSNYGAGAGVMESAHRAVSISPADPESYVGRAVALLDANEAKAAAGDYERAIALRPRDFRLWMALGNARDQAADSAGAITAFKQATELAPFYAQTHWQFGNLLLRAGRYDEALAELRRASVIRPALALQVIDLTWGIYKGDARAVESVIQPQTAAARMALAVYFAQRAKGEDAIRLFRESRPVSDKDRHSLLAALLASKQFLQAYDVWATFHDPGKDRRPQTGVALAQLIDGGFENEIRLDDPGFGWQINPNAQAVEFSLDSGDPAAGARSLLIKWNGESPPAREVISQIVLVEPQKRYQLNFAARTRNLVTAGLPIVTVADPTAQGPPGSKLAQSSPLAQNTNGWQKFSLTFETNETTHAVRIAIERQHCSMAICPIFGQAWFDGFTMSQYR
jgi:tetratricopeptide (TPR) repeat protein